MDEIVKAAIAKWPNVPHCYGWLGLDARGHWRMRDERIQALGQPGEKITNPALLGFINRNYQCDDEGRWYFQNGPQRVYIELEVTPYIARVTPQGLVVQSGAVLTDLQHVYLSQHGALLFENADILAQLDDRDMAICLEWMQLDDRLVSDDALLAWLDHSTEKTTSLYLHPPAQAAVPIQKSEAADLMKKRAYIASPAQAEVSAKTV
ncbi:DUF2946 family protein [Undibacterium sp. Jales W-56]|uniref:DUF2946 family protein n=1 Tax=Undibacterium sp. Jales W-56 TaxID=2897325 RepID=UPI0021D2CA85|nr:DUF2946 family protein [Undibacterium sp. Jales W-56]MCU6434547.1 DUF2946 family protein [Undibacterium sp. Jales W-56]